MGAIAIRYVKTSDAFFAAAMLSVYTQAVQLTVLRIDGKTGLWYNQALSMPEKKGVADYAASPCR